VEFLRKQLIKATSATPPSVINSIFNKGEGYLYGYLSPSG
ncbi:unnamed protein product, partial [Acidithrix sp. C25]